MDLLDRLIADICAVTETLMSSDQIELEAWPFSKSVERTHASLGHDRKDRHLAHRPMSEGVHRSVC
jgi:glutamate decarboxylase